MISGEPDAGKSACPVRRGESGSHRNVFALSPTLLHGVLLVVPSFRLDRPTAGRDLTEVLVPSNTKGSHVESQGCRRASPKRVGKKPPWDFPRVAACAALCYNRKRMDDAPIIRKYTSFDEMKADEYRYWQSRPAY